MNKNKLILLTSVLLGCIILGCFYYINENNKQVLIAKLQTNNPEADKKNDDFAKKVECEKYKGSIIQEIDKYNNSQVPEIRNSSNTGTGDEEIDRLYVENKEFKEVFYSPKVNSCLYLEISRTLISNPYSKINERKWGVSFEYYNLIDILSNEEVDSVFTINRSERMDSYDNNGKILFNIYSEADDMINGYK